MFPEKDVTCHKCHRKGHYKEQCLSKIVAVLHTEDSENTLESAFLGVLSTDGKAPWMVKLQISGCTVEFKIDTGAEVTAISE